MNGLELEMRRFNEKVKARMMSLVEGSRGLVVADAQHRNWSLCTHGLVLQKGRMRFVGPLDEALQVYQDQIG